MHEVRAIPPGFLTLAERTTLAAEAYGVKIIDGISDEEATRLCDLHHVPHKHEQLTSEALAIVRANR